MGQNQSPKYEIFTFLTDGKVHNSDIIVPTTNMSILVEVQPRLDLSYSTLIWFDTDITNNTNRYLQVAFYVSYAYFDFGKVRNVVSLPTYDPTVVNRFALSSYDNGLCIKYINNTKFTTNNLVFGGLTEIGNLRGNVNKDNHQQRVTAYLYKNALTDEQLQAYITDGTIP